MATKKKMLEAAAGNAGGAGALNVEDVFSTYLYEGTDSSQTITNDIDLSGEGGLVWIKSRGSTENHWLFDSERGTNGLASNETSAQSNFGSTGVSSLNSDGFTLGSNSKINGSVEGPFASWTFRKAPKFFDVVTYTGTASPQNISHNLGSVPGMIITKRTDGVGNWVVYHRGADATAPEDKYAFLETTTAFQDTPVWNDTAPTDTQFTVGVYSNNNASGGSYVAYLFAHNDGDGEFGSEADQDIIKCGSYTGSGAGSLPNFIDLGFEPQWVMIKNTTDSNTSWAMFDSMRTLNLTGEARLIANGYDSEYYSYNYNSIAPTPTGFNLTNGESWYNASGKNYIYMAIRRGPMAVPESATEVFDIATRDATHPSFDSSLDTVDFSFVKNSAITGSWRVTSRLQGAYFLYSDTTTAEAAYTPIEWDYMDGWSYSIGTASTFYSWMWKRAPGFFDVVSYTGNLTAGHTINHNLGVAPEMIWVKVRNSTYHWFVYHSALTSNGAILLSQDAASFTGTTYWNDTDPTSSDFTLGTSINVNNSAKTYIAYLFASLDGVSKVGSFSHTTGSDTNVDCGFSSGARFVLVKRYNDTGNWTLWDSARGIVAGNDPRLFLNSSAAENTATDAIDPYSSGFTITGNWLATGDYIFYAIA